jgi:UPF0755 protein
VLVAAAVTALVIWETWRVLSPAPGLHERSIIVTIPPQQGALQVAARLQQAGAIRSPEGFLALSFFRGTLGSLKAGDYEVPRLASTPNVLELLENGRVRPHVLLHPEGATFAELARALERAGLAEAGDVLRTATDPSFLWLHGIEGSSVEGYLWPDTYHFVRGMTAAEMLGRMVQRTHTRLHADLRERARARNLTIHEVLTLASIIEREAAVPEEQGLIAAVFWNRLRLGMLLQADPTVQYAVGRQRQPLTRADLLFDHPYNTYTRAGLPPGPIASPGLAAIEAAIEPASVDYLYFVKRDERRHRFSRTLDEHIASVAQYRSWSTAGQHPQPRSEGLEAPARGRDDRAKVASGLEPGAGVEPLRNDETETDKVSAECLALAAPP